MIEGSDQPAIGDPHVGTGAGTDAVELPRPTAAPLVLALGITLVAAGMALGPAFLAVGALILIAGLSLWIGQLLPGRGHVHVPLPEAVHVPRPVSVERVGVQHLRPGLPGYRLRLPERVHPISAGLKGGLVGGLVMPIPALLWGILSGHGLWYPMNLLAGMVLPGVDRMTVPELEQFQIVLILVALVIHVVLSAVIGLIYGVLLPTLPEVPRAIAWGGLLMPILWTGVSYAAMSVANPVLPSRVSWPWFIVSQFVFGITMSAVVVGSDRWPAIFRGVVGGIAGGVAMAVPAVLWAVAGRHGFWHPINLVAGMVLSEPGNVELAELGGFRIEWFLAAAVIHAGLSVCFGVLFALVNPLLSSIAGPVAWGGLVLPLIWTGTSYALMGVVNPVLQERVDWPWFMVSQFVFGVATAVVVLRSEMVPIEPAGIGRDRVEDVTPANEGGAP